MMFDFIKMHKFTISKIIMIVLSLNGCHGNAPDLSFEIKDTSGNEIIVKKSEEERLKEEKDKEKIKANTDTEEVVLTKELDTTDKENTKDIPPENSTETPPTPLVNPVKNTELKTYFGPMLNAYYGLDGSTDGESIFQKTLEIKEEDDTYKIKVSTSDLFLKIYNDLLSVPNNKKDVFKFAKEYNLKFSNKEKFIYFLTSYKSEALENYALEGIENNEGIKSYKYKSLDTPYKVYSRHNTKSYKLFEDLQKEHSEFQNIKYLQESNGLISAEFAYEGDEKIYTLEDLYEKDPKFKRISIRNEGCFLYEGETVRYKTKDLGVSDIIEEEIKEKNLILNFLGDKTELSYADYGYWQEELLLENNVGEYREKGLALPLIGGV